MPSKSFMKVDTFHCGNSETNYPQLMKQMKSRKNYSGWKKNIFLALKKHLRVVKDRTDIDFCEDIRKNVYDRLHRPIVAEAVELNNRFTQQIEKGDPSKVPPSLEGEQAHELTKFKVMIGQSLDEAYQKVDILLCNFTEKSDEKDRRLKSFWLATLSINKASKEDTMSKQLKASEQDIDLDAEVRKGLESVFEIMQELWGELPETEPDLDRLCAIGKALLKSFGAVLRLLCSENPSP